MIGTVVQKLYVGTVLIPFKAILKAFVRFSYKSLF